MSKHIDELVLAHAQKEAELLAIGQKISASGTPIIIAFVDLAESTQLKQNREPEKWLGYVYKFINHIDACAKKASGTVVKRIGDELMITFSEILASEKFIDLLFNQPDPSPSFQYKIAVDFGTAYHFRFLENLPDDPYGIVVDRCARILKFARAGTVICTSKYLNALPGKSGYVSAGDFTLRGFGKPEELFIRTFTNTENNEYFEPLITAVSDASSTEHGYRHVSRKFTPDFIRRLGNGKARPFLAKELLNIPKLPYSQDQLGKLLRESINHDEKEMEFVGYFMEVSGTFTTYKQDDDEIVLKLKLGNNPEYLSTANLMLPPCYLEIVQALAKDQPIQARGVIHHIFLSILTLNYVDFNLV